MVCGECSEREYPQDFPVIFTKDVTNITSEGARFNARLESLGRSQNVIKYGFVWGETKSPTIQSSNSFVSVKIKQGDFYKDVSNDLKIDQVYFVRAFIQTDLLIVYGNTLQFKSKGSATPIITDFTPKEGYDSTVVIIKGKNFSGSTDGNEVRFSVWLAKVLEASDTLLKVKSPKTPQAAYHYISIRVAGKQSLAVDLFHSIK